MLGKLFVITSVLSLFLFCDQGNALDTSFLDPSFGDRGVSIIKGGGTVVPVAGMGPYSAVATLDGGVAVVGTVGRELTVLKLTSDGLIDERFGDAGLASVAGYTVWPEGGICFAQQADGKLVMGLDTYFDPGGEFILARVNADGTFDETFGVHGVAILPFPDRFFAHKIVVLADGKMLMAATSSQGLKVVRLLSNGQIDTLFGSQGYATGTVSIENNHAGQVPDLWVQADGKILVNSISILRSGEQWSLTRFTAAGALDTSFGINGYVHVPAARVNGSISGFVLFPDGRIAMSDPSGGKAHLYDSTGQSLGSCLLPSSSTYAVLSNGNIATAGAKVYDPVNNSVAASTTGLIGYSITVTADPGGGFLITGDSNYPSYELEVARYQANGSPVAEFGNGGLSKANFIGVENTSATQVAELDTSGINVLAQPTTGAQLVETARSATTFALDAAGMPGTPSQIPLDNPLVTLDETSGIVGINNGFVEYLPGTTVLADLPFGQQVYCLRPLATGSVLLGGGDVDSLGNSVAVVRKTALSSKPTRVNFPPFAAVKNLIPDRTGGWFASLTGKDLEAKAIARVTAGLALDTTFGNRGQLSLPKDAKVSGSQFICDMGGGRIALVLDHASAPYHTLILMNAFGKTLKTLPLAEFSAGMVQLQVGADGVLMMAGPTPSGFAVRRLAANDTLDSAFGGEVANGFGHSDNVWSLKRTQRGEWFVSGGTKRVSAVFPFVAKLMPELNYVVPPTVGTVPVLDRRTGLFNFTVQVANSDKKPSGPSSLRVMGLPAGTTVWNGHQEGRSASWLVPVPVIDAQSSVSVTLKFYIPSRRFTPFQPLLQWVSNEK